MLPGIVCKRKACHAPQRGLLESSLFCTPIEPCQGCPDSQEDLQTHTHNMFADHSASPGVWQTTQDSCWCTFQQSLEHRQEETPSLCHPARNKGSYKRYKGCMQAPSIHQSRMPLLRHQRGTCRSTLHNPAHSKTASLVLRELFLYPGNSEMKPQEKVSEQAGSEKGTFAQTHIYGSHKFRAL